MIKINKKIFFKILIVGLIYYLLLQSWQSVNVIKYNNNLNDSTQIAFGEITKNNVLHQNLKLNKNQNIDFIKIYIATYARINNNNNEIKIYHNGVEIFNKKIKSENLKDNSIFTINNLNIKYKTQDDLYLEISSENGETNNAITVWTQPDVNNGTLYSYNKENDKYTLCNGEITMIIGNTENFLYYLSHHNVRLPIGLSLLMLLCLSFLIIGVIILNLSVEVITKPKNSVNIVNKT